MLNAYEQQNRDEFLDGLRKLLDLYERIPEMPGPVTRETICLFTHDLGEFLHLRREAALEDKGEDDDYHQFIREVSPKLKLILMLNKQHTCERVRVGTRTIAAIPAMPAIPARGEHAEDIYEWVCPPSLLELNETGGPVITQAEMMAATRGEL